MNSTLRGRKPAFVTGRVPRCDGFCDGLVFCKLFSINECDGVTAQTPWKAPMPAPPFWGIDQRVIQAGAPSCLFAPKRCQSLPETDLRPLAESMNFCLA
jgi:hypothetical protein